MTGPLRIGVDARELLGDTTGVGRYLGELMRRWTARPDAGLRRFILYAPEQPPLPLPAGAVDYRVGGSGRGTVWEQTWLRRAVRADRPHVFFAPAYTAPAGTGIPLAVTIHDVSFAAHPEWFGVREGLRRRLLTGYAARNAAVVLTVSDFSRREIARHFAVDPRRIRVIYEGLAPRTQDPPPAEGRQPLILYVGSILNRRRLPDLVAAFARVKRDVPAARLVITGADRSWPPIDLRAVAYAHGVERDVEIRRYVEDGELARLYETASAFAFLSEYEGFGITPLEALAANVPVVLLDTAVAREICGDAAVYVPAEDVNAVADALKRLLTMADARAAVLAHAPAVLSRYSWEAAAAATLVELERVAKGTPSAEPRTPSPEPRASSAEPRTPIPEPRTPSPEPRTPSPGPRAPSPEIALSIVIVSFNARAEVEAGLQSLMKAPPAVAHDITLVDNASTDDVAGQVAAKWPSVRVIEMGRNAGFAAANNAGIRATAGTYVLLLNSDTIVPPGAVDALVNRLEATPEAAVAGPRIVDGAGAAELSFGRMISPLAELRQRIRSTRRGWIERATRRERFVDWVSGACLLVRRSDAEAVGLLDERFFLYTEDVDFCAAIRARGRRVLFTPAAEIVHLRGRSRATAPGHASEAYRRSHVAFYEKHHPRWAALLKLYLKMKGEIE